MPEETFETPHIAVETKTTNWPKMILAAVLGLGLLAGAAYAGYYYGLQQVQQIEEPTPVVSQPTPTPESTPTTTQPTTDLTADWKTYTNEEYRYSLQYPSNNIDIAEGMDLKTSLLPGEQPVYQVVLTKSGQEYLTIETTKNYSPDYSSTPIYLGTRSRGERIIDAALWNEFFIPNEYGEGPYIPPVYALTKETGGVLYGIYVRQKNTNEEQNQILSTFKFLE